MAPAEYLIYVDARAIGVVEAKPVGYPLKVVQAYRQGMPTESLRLAGRKAARAESPPQARAV
jgi:hypothetical protein